MVWLIFNLILFFIGQYYIEFPSAIVKFYNSCSDQSIGGEGIVVEINETRMGKRKYNRGHRVEGMCCRFILICFPFYLLFCMFCMLYLGGGDYRENKITENLCGIGAG